MCVKCVLSFLRHFKVLVFNFVSNFRVFRSVCDMCVLSFLGCFKVVIVNLAGNYREL